MYAAVHLPTFHLQAALRWREELWAVPAAVVDTQDGCICERNLPAAARDISAGMPVALALARCAELKVFSIFPAKEAALSVLLQDIALSHSPFVEATQPDIVVLDWRGVLHQIDWHTQGDHLRKDLLAAGLKATVGVAPTPDVAILAARETDAVSVVRDRGEYLGPLPLSHLTSDARILSVLEDWGIHTIGQFLRLPKADVIARLGAGAEEMWRVANGRTQRPLKLVAPPEVYREAFDFEHVVETTAPLLFLLRRFVDQLSSRLQVRYVVASQMTLRLPLDDGETYERVFSIPEPTSEADVMFRTLETHLDQLTLPQQPVGLSLEIEAVEPTRQQFGLFGTRLRDPNRFGHTLARIGALVGVREVGFPVPEDTHKPDSYQLAPRVAWNAEEPGEPNREWLGLPLQRCRPAIAATVETRNSCPVRISSALADGRITEALGPYRLSGHWWDPAAWQLEEWDIALGDGLYRIARRDGQWWVEGCYERVC